MKIDLKHSLKQGMDNLITWRNRYSKTEYAEKIVLNIFYRKHTINFMFNDIINCFIPRPFDKSKLRWNDVTEGYKTLNIKYSTTAVSKTRPILETLLKNTKENIGNTNYYSFSLLISAVKIGDNDKLEEIEYSYLYYLLTDECILLWGALGGTGLSKKDAVSKMSGLIIEIDEIKTYGQIEQVLGQLCTAKYMNENYKPLPPNV